MKTHYRVFAWAGLACMEFLILYQIFYLTSFFGHAPNIPPIVLADILPICIFFAVMYGANRHGICLVVGISCLLWTFVEIGALHFLYTFPISTAFAILPRCLFEALPTILIGVALILYARKRRFPYVGWFTVGAAVLYWLYTRKAFRVSGPSSFIMAWPLVDIVYILLAFAVQFLPNTVIASKRDDEKEVSQ